MKIEEKVLSGTPQENRLFTDVYGHYSMAKQDLETRIYRKNGFDDADKLYASHIDENNWPYKSMIFNPIPYSTVLEKGARLIGNKPKGRLVPREGGDSLGAYINNELLMYQWDDNTRLGDSMISKWIMMDQNARKYGSSFALCKWHWEKRSGKTFFDGPDFTPCNPRDVLANPSYSFINKWFQHREWNTLQELYSVNDAAQAKPIYKNLDKIKDAIKEENKLKGKGDKRESAYQSKNKSMRGLTDYLGADEVYKVIEIITEYRPDRWITFSPRYGVVIRDIPNPYNHGEIPVVHLKYYPLPDDLYGVSEYEPVAKMFRADNALFSQYADNIAVDLYPPLMVNPVNVRMHTLEFSPEAKWLMNQPGVDVKRLETSTSATNNFASAHQIIMSSILSSLGESSQGYSSLNPTQDQGRVTATEIKNTAFIRNVRDNMNQIFLSDDLKKQIMFWHSMNQQFMFSAKNEQLKIIRIVGKDAIAFFERNGLGDIQPTEEQAQMIATGALKQEDVVPGPRFAVQVGADESGMPMEVPKMMMDETGEGANLLLEPGDLNGSYDYIPDVEAMKTPTDEDVSAQLKELIALLTNPVILQTLAQEQVKPKMKDLLVKAIEATKIVKDADPFFESVQAQPTMGMEGGGMPNGQAVPGGVNPPEAGIPSQGNVPVGGMEGSVPPMAGGQNQAFMG